MMEGIQQWRDGPLRAVSLTGRIDFRTGFWGTPKPWVEELKEYGHRFPPRPDLPFEAKEAHRSAIVMRRLEWRPMRNDDILPLYKAQGNKHDPKLQEK